MFSQFSGREWLMVKTQLMLKSSEGFGGALENMDKLETEETQIEQIKYYKALVVW